MKLFKIVIILLLTLQISANYERLNLDISKYENDPSLYYPDIAGLLNENLKESLTKILNMPHRISESKTTDELTNPELCSSDCYSHNVLGYKEARKVLFGEINQLITKNEHEVFDYYCSLTYKDGDIIKGNEFKFESGVIPSATVINTEHLWPKSHFGIDEESDYGLYEMMVSDLHHLLPTDTIVNRDRYNFSFGEVERSNKDLPCEGPIVGRNQVSQDTFFEPPSEYKGDIARAIFYFSTKYNLPIDQIQEEFLRKWHEQDKVSEVEIKRNNIIHKLQGTRNPFIDFPNFVSRISDF